MVHLKSRDWDRRLKAMFDEIDDWLERKYGSLYPRHPNRPERGATSNKEMDGLFNVGAVFSAGYGSELGRGYVVQVRMSTLDHVSEDIRNEIEDHVVKMVRERLPKMFPGRDLTVERDGRLLKIVGDFSLGSVLQE